jgi:SNF2 family DNA or RNA helicase
MELQRLLDDLLEGVPFTVKKKGLELYMQEHFLEPVISMDSPGFEVSVVSFSGQEQYDVELRYDEVSDELHSSCTCPYFKTEIKDCEHIVAAAFQWKKMGQKPRGRSSVFTVPGHLSIVRDDQIGEEFTYQIRSLEYWELKKYNGYFYSGTVKKEELLIDSDAKSCSLKFDGKLVSATFVDLGHLCMSCGCGMLTQNKFCAHVAILLRSIEENYGAFYFRTFHDYSAEIAAAYRMYGLKPGSALADAFKFGVNSAGEFKILARPANLLPLSEYASWDKELSAIQPLKKSNPTPGERSLPANITAAGLMIYLGGKNNQPFWLEGVVVTENRAKISYKRNILQSNDDLLAFQHLSEKALQVMGRLTMESLLDDLTMKTGSVYLTTYANPISQLDSYAKSLLLAEFRLALKELLDIGDPGLKFYTLDPGVSFSSSNCIPVRLRGNQDSLRFHLSFKDEFWIIRGLLDGGDGAVPLSEFTLYPPLFLKYAEQLYLLNVNDEKIITSFRDGDVMAHQRDTGKFLDRIVKPLSAKYKIDFDPAIEPERIEEQGTPLVYLSELNESFLMIRPKWKYSEFEAEMDGSAQSLFGIGENIFMVIRQKEEEDAFIAALRDLHPSFKIQRGNEYFYLPFKEALEKSWFIGFFAEMQRFGVRVFGISELKKFKYNSNSPVLRSKVSSSIDWFDLSIEVHYGNQVVGLADLKKAILAKQEYILLEDGTFGVLPEEWLEKYSNLFKMGQVKDELLKVAKFHYTLMDELRGQIDDQQVLEELIAKKERLQHIGDFKEVTLPPGIRATLRDYQLAGFQWMNQLDEICWGGCLSDDMGLGKTLQTLAFLQYRIQQHPEETHLIVCPTSLLYNWEMEIQKFTSGMKYHIYYGGDRVFKEADFRKNNLIISSYGMVRSDIRHFAKFDFGYVVLDESQMIKNPAAQVTIAVQLLKARNRFILSGTPIQNNTFDLYAQMSFLNPGMLGSAEFFRTEFATAIDKYNDRDKSALLKKMIAPFMLRRTKEQVAKDLPDKTEMILWCEMEADQRRVYDEFKRHYRETLMERIEEEGMGKNSMYILEGLLKLRQICDSTVLLKDDRYVADSIKMKELLRELTENTGAHKALIFSQFTEMLSLIRLELDKIGISYSYLDGSTPAHKRQEAVDQFQQDDAQRVFLISLKAGGVGLNLTSADYVYLIDPWWNPAVEQQAIDRTHRIGQMNKIFAYKMICKDTVEEKIMQLQEKKKALASDLIGEETGFVKKLSKEDVAFLFS